ncbi:MAG: hypothetical protein SFU87_10920 [Chitinophagaceae bacterium]|nr:hypothetical protein [Chitinophagaceae bacterium]
MDFSMGIYYILCKVREIGRYWPFVLDNISILIVFVLLDRIFLNEA